MASEPQFDGCEVVEKLRSGPATDWYLGKQRSLGRAVVIKALSPNVLPESPFAGPLVREAKLLARLQHKSIVQLYEFVQRPRTMWLVLEQVDGVSLEELLARTERLSIPAALAIMRQLVTTLAYVHGHDIVHRDLHPKNIWVSRDGELKLSNFFLAAERSTPPPPELLEADSGFQSPSYMSPEQLLSEATDPRSDLFSAGVILYEMVTGQRPFDASDTRRTTQRIRHEPAPSMSRYCPDVPPAVERIVLRALQKLPADRFQDAAEMNVMIEAALAQYGSLASQTVILEEMVRVGVVEGSPDVQPRVRKTDEPVGVLRRGLFVYGTCFALLAGGGVVIREVSSKPTHVQTTGRNTLELVPQGAGYLSCVVHPWAHVFIDGQQVATTPFATPIPLRAGTHYVRFEHPEAPTEQRQVTLSAGQRILLDIEMQLRTAPAEVELDLTAPPYDAGAHSP
jgi:serine/threonine-protein kinase